MKTPFIRFFTTVAAALALAISAQVQQPAPPDTLVSAIAQEAGLPLVSPEALPPHGTFWMFYDTFPIALAPLPCPPLDRSLPAYAITDSGRQFLVDATGTRTNRFTFTAQQQAERTLRHVERLILLIDQVRTAEATRAERQLLGVPEMSLLLEQEELELDSFLYSTNELWIELVSVTNTAGTVVVHPPSTVTNGVYDLFSTTNLAAPWWQFVARTTPGQTNVAVTNLVTPELFFIAGVTNDTDNGGLTDAYEGLAGLNIQDSSDDYVEPVIGITVLDSVATEQYPSDTATFCVTRKGGHTSWPFVVPFSLSGTAVRGVNYGLSPVSANGSGALATIPAGTNSLIITLSPMDDQTVTGTRKATLTVESGLGWSVDSSHSSATAWIIEEYVKTFTVTSDFEQGVRVGLDTLDVMPDDNGRLQFKTDLPPQFPFIAVACSGRGTVARINTTNGQVIGEYRTTPAGLMYTGDSGSGPQPSRTTVDLFGNVWVANRADDFPMNRATNGSITRVGLIIGSRFSKSATNTYYADPSGHYVRLSDASYNTCVDRDGDGYIRTSSGLADILAWTNQRGGWSDADSYGGVSTAEDEAITEYVRIPCRGTRTIAVDKFNDIWVGGRSGRQEHLKVDGLTGKPVLDSLFVPRCGGYGGVIDSLGALWSANPDSLGSMRLLPPASWPVTTNDWQVLQTGDWTADNNGYGLGVDPIHPHV